MKLALVKRLFVFVSIFILLFTSTSFAARKKRKSKRVSCQAAILMDSSSGRRLFAKNADGRVLPASTTKVMTAILVLEKLSLDDYVVVKERATYVQPSKIDIRAGEQYKVRDLLYALLLGSANDASVALAEAVAGSEYNFVQMMNKRAKQLGAYHTKFANSNGLPTPRVSQYTSAYDMYLIFRKAMQYAFFKEAIKYRYRIIHSKAGRRIVLKSHNRLLFNDWKRMVYGKTGYTRTAGACFVGTIQKGNNTLIVGVFNCTNRWDYIKYIVTKFGGVAL